MKNMMTLTVSSETLEKIEEATKEYLATPDFSGSAWFNTKEQAENWMGDVFSDAMDYYMLCLGIRLIIEEENF